MFSGKVSCHLKEEEGWSPSTVWRCRDQWLNRKRQSNFIVKLFPCWNANPCCMWQFPFRSALSADHVTREWYYDYHRIACVCHICLDTWWSPAQYWPIMRKKQDRGFTLGDWLVPALTGRMAAKSIWRKIQDHGWWQDDRNWYAYKKCLKRFTCIPWLILQEICMVMYFKSKSHVYCSISQGMMHVHHLSPH